MQLLHPSEVCRVQGMNNEVFSKKKIMWGENCLTIDFNEWIIEFKKG